MAGFQQPLHLNNSAPPFPSLYIPRGPLSEGEFLYNPTDVWKFTSIWTVIIYECFHAAASGYAAIVQPRNWRASWLAILIYVVVGGTEALLAGSVVGLM